MRGALAGSLPPETIGAPGRLRARVWAGTLTKVAAIFLGALLTLAAWAPLIANDAPLVARVGGRLTSPAFRALGPADVAWGLSWLSAALLWCVRKQLVRRVDRRRAARTTAVLAIGLLLITALAAAAVRPENVSVIDWRRIARQPGNSAVWAPIEHGWRSLDDRPGMRLRSPGAAEGHPLGTDSDTRDVVARLIFGARTSLLVGLFSAALASVLGVLIGGAAGWLRGRTDAFLSWMIQVVMCFPVLLTVVVLQAILPPSVWWIVLLLGLTRWTGPARLFRGEVMRLRAAEFVDAARALGASGARILFRHILPNGLAPVIVNAAFGVAGAILIESALSFLGLGTPRPEASWGEMLRQGGDHVDRAPHLVLLPGLLIFVTVTACHRIGEGLRAALDPRLEEIRR